MSQDWLGLQIALAPCLLGYGALAKMLHRDPRSVRQGNHYWNWVENYVAADYVQAVETGSGGFAGPAPLPSSLLRGGEGRTMGR
jgi:hydroxymethylpyrimidine/phosphomethylpyrimidine kinase / thiaminase